MPDDSRSIHKLKSIQVLRALAALLVVTFHASANIVRHGWTIAAAQVIGGYGEIGVDIFFVVSGFVMAATTQHTVQSAQAARGFIVSRLTRIVPLYWITTSCFVMLLIVAPRVFGAATFSLPHVIASYAFIPWRNPLGEPAPVLNVGWTLNYEMWFYLVYAVAILVAQRRVALISAFFCAASLLGLVGFTNIALRTYTSPITLEFVFGVIVGTLYTRGMRLSALHAAIMLAVALAALWLPGPHVEDAIRFLSFGMPAALLVAAAVAVETRIRWPASLYKVGDASYSLYLMHVFTVPVAVKVLSMLDTHHRLPGSVICAASVLLSVGIALLGYRTIEKPLGRALRTISLPRGPRTASPG
ncbi:acyltransferase [Paraburkholderia sp. Ac-20336]|uniref:acyltransferase family protein n=1 Tax=Paraburkholderia sp. Ac-20336 TaxID=2703886 RepID=UPI0019811F12|nr:acyltransferase [Paraburkholderia sp. Ac-20336]MBN3804524.1 acyltransferase [Paraburkholderia sp. Ac-20336]